MVYNDEILIIDDTIAEVDKIIEYFGKKGQAIRYLTGKDSEIEKSFPKVVILDLHLLEGLGDVESSVSYTVNFLNSAIENKENFYIFLWSKHAENVSILEKNLKTVKIDPLAIIQLDKVEILNNLDLLEERLNEILSSDKFKVINFISDWKNNLSKASRETLNVFTKREGKNWDESIINILSNFSQQKLEQNYSTRDNHTRLQAGLEILNHILIDNIIKKQGKNIINLEEAPTTLTDYEKFELNAKLHFKEWSISEEPGVIYQLENGYTNIELEDSEKEIFTKIIDKFELSFLKKKCIIFEKLFKDKFESKLGVSKKFVDKITNSVIENLSNDELLKLIAECQEEFSSKAKDGILNFFSTKSDDEKNQLIEKLEEEIKAISNKIYLLFPTERENSLKYLNLKNQEKIIGNVIKKLTPTKEILDSLIKDSLEEHFKIIALEITPGCDHAQNKEICKSYILGVQFSLNLEKYKELLDDKPKEFRQKLFLESDSMVKLPLFVKDDNLNIIVFDNRMNTTTILEDKKILYKMSDSLLNETQSKLASHKGRIGHISFA